MAWVHCQIFPQENAGAKIHVEPTCTCTEWSVCHLIAPGVEIHDEVLGLGVPVADLALVAVGVPGHLLWHVAVLLDRGAARAPGGGGGGGGGGGAGSPCSSGGARRPRCPSLEQSLVAAATPARCTGSLKVTESHRI